MATLELDVKLKGLREQLRQGIDSATKGGVSTSKDSKKGGLAGIANLAVMAGGITAIVALLSQISGIFKSSIGALIKVIGLFLKPIGDILGLLLMNLVRLFAPFAKIINTLFRPYLKAASVAMAAGQRYAKKGQMDKAGEAFGMAQAAILTPIVHLLLTVVNVAVQAVIGGLQVILSPFAAAFARVFEIIAPGLGALFLGAFNASFATARTQVNTAITGLMTLIDTSLFGKINELAMGAGLKMQNFTAGVTTTFQSMNDTITSSLNTVYADIAIPLQSLISGIDADKIRYLSKYISDVMTNVNPLNDSLLKTYANVLQVKGGLDAANRSLKTFISNIEKIRKAAEAFGEGVGYVGSNAVKGPTVSPFINVAYHAAKDVITNNKRAGTS